MTDVVTPPASFHRRRRVLLGSGALAVSGLLPAGPGPFGGARRAMAAAGLEFNSPYNFIRIDKAGSVVTFSYSLVAGRLSAIDLARPAYQVVNYTRYFHAADLVRPNPRQVLMAGLGAGGFNRLFNLIHPEARLVSVEIDPMIADLAREHAAFRPGPRDEVVVDDARQYLRRSNEAFDWIVLDAFDKEAQIPVHLTTREFYETLRERLAPGGVLAANLHQGTRFFASHVLTIRAVFPDVVLVPVEGRTNLIAVAARPPSPSVWEGIVEAAARAGGDGRAARYLEHGVDLAEIARNAVGEGDYLEYVQGGRAMVLTDDFAPVESLEREGSPTVAPRRR